MSEFKFACPVCAQHITADASTSGTQLECPTCFQKIVVPQAPASADSKFILSASQVSKPRPLPAEALAGAPAAQPARASKLVPAALVLLVVVLAAGAGWLAYTKQIFKPAAHPTPVSPQPLAEPATLAQPASAYPVPKDVSWRLDLANVALPESPAAGSIRSSGFFCERSTLQGGTLTLRQGKGWPPDLGITLTLPARQAEELSGRALEIGPGSPAPVPKVVLRWKDEQQQGAKQDIRAGYALKLAFGQATNGHMPGKIYLCLPDDAKSFVAGTFNAEIRKPPPPKQGKRKKG